MIKHTILFFKIIYIVKKTHYNINTCNKYACQIGNVANLTRGNKMNKQVKLVSSLMGGLFLISVSTSAQALLDWGWTGDTVYKSDKEQTVDDKSISTNGIKGGTDKYTLESDSLTFNVNSKASASHDNALSKKYELISLGYDVEITKKLQAKVMLEKTFKYKLSTEINKIKLEDSEYMLELYENVFALDKVKMARKNFIATNK